MTRRQFVGAALAVLCAAPLLGCGAGGPKRYTVSGAVALGGKPVPAGEIAFEPDASKGNSGPGSVVRIRDGRYQTEPGLGLIGGAYVVRIIPLNGTPAGDSLDGKPLLPGPHVESVEFPAADGTRDFDIPAPGKK